MQKTVTTLLRKKKSKIETKVWKNLLFMKDGRSVFGYHEFDSEQAARLGIAGGEIKIKKYSAIMHAGKVLYRTEDYSHAIPVEVRKSCPQH